MDFWKYLKDFGGLLPLIPSFCLFFDFDKTWTLSKGHLSNIWWFYKVFHKTRSFLLIFCKIFKFPSSRGAAAFRTHANMPPFRKPWQRRGWSFYTTPIFSSLPLPNSKSCITPWIINNPVYVNRCLLDILKVFDILWQNNKT